MYFIDLLKNYWEVIVGFLLVTLWVGSDHNRLNRIEESQKLHRKAHAGEAFVSVNVCREQMGQCNRINKMQFSHGAEQFTRLEAVIAAKELKDENRHSEIMRLLLEMNRK